MAATGGMDALIERWRGAWPQALEAWSRYTRLHDARLCASTLEAAQEGLRGSFAAIRLLDHSVVIDLEEVCVHGLQEYAVEILAHEIGHHVLAPGSATDHLRLLARMRTALPGLEQHVAMVANLYTDLCINDRLQRQRALRMADTYRALAHRSKGELATTPSNPLWTLYMRIYEHLWKLDRGELAGQRVTDAIDADAWLGAQLIRVYGNEWMSGAGRFATLVLPYLLDEATHLDPLQCLHDTAGAAEGCAPGDIHEIEDDELDGAVHPLHDVRITGDDRDLEGVAPATNRSGAQAREPFEYGEILKAAGIGLDDHEIAMRYYRERAQPHLIPFPATRPKPAAEPLISSVEPWDIGEQLDQIDWLHSLSLGPKPIPGLTIVQRAYETDPGTEPRLLPPDLDLYVDSSGSMPNPQCGISYLALAGAIIALSALRAGASVQVTLWSGKAQVLGTEGFVRGSDAVLRVLTGFYGGATCFPIHRLRDTYAARSASRPAHLLMISDDGITTMFDKDEKGNSGWEIAAKALHAAGGGGTMALNAPTDWASRAEPKRASPWRDLLRARDEQGWDVHAVANMEQLVAFARAFSRRQYSDGLGPSRRNAGAWP